MQPCKTIAPHRTRIETERSDSSPSDFYFYYSIYIIYLYNRVESASGFYFFYYVYYTYFYSCEVSPPSRLLSPSHESEPTQGGGCSVCNTKDAV